MSETTGQKHTKSLDTLIDDIYGKLEGLSHGKSLNIPEDEIERTVDGLRECLLHWSNPTERNRKFSVRMSNVGRPPRLLWFDKNSDTVSTPDPATQIKFLYGHLLEEIVLMLVRISGHHVSGEQKEARVGDIVGSMDSIIDGEVVDIKTASKFAFNKFRLGTLAENDSFGYLAQLACYEHSEGTENGGFLVLNKESGELCLFRPDDLDKPNIEERIKYVTEAVYSDEMPEICYEPVADGKKGNMKLAKGCTWCSYKHECFKDANDGQGLRAFKYANGVTYFTEVVAEPNVEEIL
jgi:hypothetical protein